MYLPKPFFLFSGAIGIAIGGLYGCVRTSLFFVEQMDALGKDYELSRVMKQDIFDTRPDLDSGKRA
jgi:hypothetical protein